MHSRCFCDRQEFVDKIFALLYIRMSSSCILIDFKRKFYSYRAYIEHFMESLTERVRQLAGWSNDLKNMLKERDASVSVFLFDEYLKNAL